MPHSLRVRLKNLQRKGKLTEKDIDRIFKALSQEPCEKSMNKAYTFGKNKGVKAYYNEQLCTVELPEAVFRYILSLVPTEEISQEPCDDAISRDFQIGDEVRIIGSDPIYDDCDVGWVIRNASEKVKTMYVMRNDGSADEEAKAEWYKTGRHNAVLAEVIKALPSVTQKSGKWDRSCTCSVCGQWRILESEKNGGKYKFCPNCGSSMKGE